MKILPLATLFASASFVWSCPAQAGLVLVAGNGPTTLSSNHYGYTGTYYDLQGKNGASEDVAHPGGGPVAYLYVFGADGAISTYFDSTAGPYDGADDAQIGVLNNSSLPIFSLTLHSTTDIFGFDSDGIDASPYNSPGNKLDTTTYGGPMTYFTGMNAAKTDGTCNFIGGLASNGGTTYFSLEEAPSIATIPIVPEPASLVMVGCGIVLAGCGAWHRRRALPRGAR